MTCFICLFVYLFVFVFVFVGKFFLHVNEISIKMHPKDLVQYLTTRRVVKIEEVVVDGLEVYIEKSDVDPTDMNLWHCLGKSM